MKKTKTVVKEDIFAALVDEVGCSRKEAVDFSGDLMDLIYEALDREQKVKIYGFGTFFTSHKKDRRGRNPHTGGEITILGRRVVGCRYSANLKEKILKIKNKK